MSEVLLLEKGRVGGCFHMCFQMFVTHLLTAGDYGCGVHCWITTEVPPNNQMASTEISRCAEGKERKGKFNDGKFCLHLNE